MDNEVENEIKGSSIVERYRSAEQSLKNLSILLYNGWVIS